MKFVGICGSPRNGNSSWLLEKISNLIKQDGNEVILYGLRNMNIKYCDGCLLCEQEEGFCHLNDDMNEVYMNLQECDGIIISTPVYFDNIPALLKNFLDRLNPICDNLEGKNVSLIVVGQLSDEEGDASRSTVIDYIKNFSNIFNMNFIDSFEISARDVGEVESKKSIEEEYMKFYQSIKGLQ
ncbi:flavodoxin family protein [Methanosarcina sp. Mfa9]|uniref:flavodoxin family protein n=1 Tax=Methanosarcina sp. Mfa9 TaxID=3439063 RepID=UPI003F82B6D2